MHCATCAGSAMAALLLVAAAPAAAQRYGGAIASTGQTVFVGQAGNQYAPGMVYIYTAGPDGLTRVQRLVASDTSNNDSFGSAIALDGQQLLVGATNAAGGKGEVYLFERRGNEYRLTGRLNPGTLPDKSSYGGNIAVQGDVAAVSAIGTQENTGTVYLFRRIGGKWAADTMLSVPTPSPNARFGGSIAMGGDLLVIGAVTADSGLGAAYVYRWADNSWKSEGKLEVPGLTKPAAIGGALAINDGRVYVGMPAAYGAGAVAVFANDTAAKRWRMQTRLQPYAAVNNARFGSAIGFSGNEVWVGAPGMNQFQGQIFRFVMNDQNEVTDVWTLKPDSLPGPALWANSFTTAGTGLLVAAPFYESGAGAVTYVSRDGQAWKIGKFEMGDETGLTAITGSMKQCRQGKIGIFSCEGADLLSFLPVKDVGGSRGVNMNDIWGWTDPETGKEYVLAGRTDGTAFIDVSNPGSPKYLGSLPKTEGSPNAAWRDIKVYKNHAYIVADASREHGMQVFDLTHLRQANASTPQTFTPDFTYTGIASAHNIVINEESGFAYAVGASSGGEGCGGGLHMIDIRDPDAPKFAGCFSDPSTGRANTGYSHDAQCVMYKGPDTRYTGREICLGSNETALSIADVTDKAKPVAISHAAYPDVGYTHQGWFDEQQRYFYMDDELDELNGKVDGTRTIIWDLAKLDEPVVASQYISKNKSSDHNLYVKGDFVFQSNYVSGLRILDIRDRTNPKQVGFFDTVPVGEDAPGFGGSWSNYPYFKSGTIAVTSGSEGLFLVKKRDMQPVP